MSLSLIEEGTKICEKERSLKTGYLFPGQGTQYVGMGKDLADASKGASNVWKTADEELGFSLSEITFNGPEKELRKTSNAQPAIFTASVATFVASIELNADFWQVLPSCVAGHSLGEYTALWAAGVLDFKTTLYLVRQRGRLMEEAGKINPGIMVALLGLSPQAVSEICQEAKAEIANINCPGQFVISGDRENINKAVELAKIAGGKRVFLEVSGAFHSKLMRPAQRAFEEVLSPINFENAVIPVFQNTSGRAETNGEAIKENLSTQITSPVHWCASINKMRDFGVSQFLEFGPGDVLTGLQKRINPHLSGKAINNLEAIKSFSYDMI